MSKTKGPVFDENGKKICGAKTKSGKPCQRDAMIGSNRCYLHGGPTPKGIASPNYKHGRYSGTMPSNLIEKYNEALTDPELLSLNDEIALLDAHVGELMAALNQGGLGGIWQELKDASAQLSDARDSGNDQEETASIESIQTLIEKGGDHIAGWASIMTQLEMRRKLVDTERKRREGIQNFVTSEQVATLVVHLANLVKAHVKDPQAISGIARGLAGILDNQSHREIIPRFLGE